MSSADATIDDTVVMTATVPARRTRVSRSVALLAVIAGVQLLWLAALVYGAFRLLV